MKASRHLPGPRGPLDVGGVWDADEQTLSDGDWVAVTFTIVGPCDWGQTLLANLCQENPDMLLI